MAASQAKKQQSSKALAQTKRRRRNLLTFWRMVRYGIHSFSRNAWLTIAATAVMTITLLIVFSAVVARDVLSNTVQTIQDKVEMTVYIEPGTERSTVESISRDINGLESVSKTSVMTPEEAREKYIEENKTDPNTLKSLNNSEPNFPWRIRVAMVDINEVDELQQFVDTNEALKEAISEDTPPSFAGPNRKAIKQIGEWARFADRAGLAAGAVFVVISALIIFNTIRMAIFNRREEIQMMKLIGAERAFIRGPFVVEAIVYGFIAAFIATGLGIFAVYSSQSTLQDKGIAMTETVDWLITYSPLVLGVMIVIGGAIGIVSSLLATHRYLRL